MTRLSAYAVLLGALVSAFYTLVGAASLVTDAYRGQWLTESLGHVIGTLFALWLCVNAYQWLHEQVRQTHP